ncbi:MAG: MOP flippase family protein [Nitrospirota bacterium]
MSLRRSIVSGMKWSSLSQAGRQVMQLATTAVLARLLGPSDFGLVGMATVVIGFVAIFKDLGTSAAVIQKKEVNERFLSSIFWVNVGFGFLSMAALFLIAPLAGSFYHETRVRPIMRLLSLSFFISGLSAVQQSLLVKDLAFSKLARIEIFATLSGSSIGIGTALVGSGAWSLVYQSLANTAVTTLLLLWICKWRPRLIFDWVEVKAVSRYSMNLTGFSILNFFERNADYIIIGRFLGAIDLGYYTLAYKLMLYPLQNISAVLARVLFPVYSRIQEDNFLFKKAYLKAAALIAMVAFPMMAGLMVISRPLILTIFGEKWKPVITLLLILAPVGMIQSIVTTIGSIYTAKGRTDIMFRVGMATTILAVAAFFVGLRWGIIGVASAYGIVEVLATYPNMWFPYRLIDMKVRELAAVLWRPLICSVAMAAVVWLAGSMLPEDLNRTAYLVYLILTGIIAYTGLSWLFNRDDMRQTLTIVGVKV